jgi:ligand-binding sensor domain-containing protein/signal transduction histidine kinase
VAQALDPHRAASQYLRDRWGAEQGFPKGPVYAIAQTTDGYLWIGSEAGLVRFDGISFKLITGQSRFSSTLSALGLTPDNDGNLWVRLAAPMMLQYRNGVFENPMAALGYSNVSAMSRTTHGALLAAAMEHGAITFRQGRFEMLASSDALPRSPVISIAQTDNHDIWMGTRDAGLFHLAGGKATAVTKGLPDPKVNCLLSDGERGLLVGTDNGLVRWNGGGLAKVGGASLEGTQVLAMAKDRDGNIWVGTGARGLLRINAQGVHSLPESGGGAVTAVFEDREGNLWTGSASGIERLRDSVFVTYSSADGLPFKGNGAIHVDAHHRAWVAPSEGGLYWLDDDNVGRVTGAGLGVDVVYSIAGDRTELWVGRQRGGLTRLRSIGNSFETKTYTQATGLAQNSVYAVHRSRDATVWAGTLTGGVSRLRDGRFTTYTAANVLASNSVSSIVEGADGTMWFATPNGVSSVAGDRWQTFTTREGLPADGVNCLLEDSSGVLWAGTRKGLARRTAGRFGVPAAAPDFLREPILGLAEERAGFLWVATTNRVLRVKRDALLAGQLGAGDIREYGLADGLPSMEGVKRHRSLAADPLGRIWFSTNRGISVVDPARLSSASAPAIAHVQTLSADGEVVAGQGPIRIPNPRQRIAFTYTGLSLSVPERIRFRYRLDAFDRRWSEPVTTREAVYTNLNPGSYRFRVIASNADGVWNGAEAVLAFEIEPMLWQTWWFRLFSVLALASAGLAAYRFRLRRLTCGLNLRFEERLAERTRISKELHDTLLQGFLGASMQLHVAADCLPEDSPAKPPVKRILQLMSQVIDEGRNAVRGLCLADNRAEDLAHAFSRIREDLAGEDLDFRVTVEGEPRPLHPIVRDDVYRLGREALVNAFRHSRAKRIEMELEYTRKRLRIVVRDDGVGIDCRLLDAGRTGHRGLAGMREQAERIGAKFSVWSSPKNGTEVEVLVPGHVAFERQPSGETRRWSAAWRKARAGASEETNGDSK